MSHYNIGRLGWTRRKVKKTTVRRRTTRNWHPGSVVKKVFQQGVNDC